MVQKWIKNELIFKVKITEYKRVIETIHLKKSSNYAVRAVIPLL